MLTGPARIKASKTSSNVRSNKIRVSSIFLNLPVFDFFYQELINLNYFNPWWRDRNVDEKLAGRKRFSFQALLL